MKSLHPVKPNKMKSTQATVTAGRLVTPVICHKRKLIAILFMGFSISLYGCKGGADRHSGKNESKAYAGHKKDNLSNRHQAAQTPDLTVVDVEGNSRALSTLKGKVVFINFWATWCPPCREELPTIQKLKDHFKGNKDVVFLMIDIDGRLDASAKYLKKHGYDLPLYKAKGAIAPQFLGDAIPTTIILDKSGAVVARLEGARDYGTKEVFSGLEQLLKG